MSPTVKSTSYLTRYQSKINANPTALRGETHHPGQVWSQWPVAYTAKSHDF